MTIECLGLRLPLAAFTLEVDATSHGVVVGVFGASGAGKTSLLEIIAGLRRPASGAVRLDGRVLSDAATGEFVRPEHRHVGYVPQEGALFPHLDVGANLRYAQRSSPNGDKAHGFDHVVTVLEIGELVHRRVATLSGGEQRRVALGRALLSSPQILLLDEPLSGLDAPLRERLLPYIRRVREEFALPMLYVSHSPDEIVALCDDVLVIEDGRIARHGPPAELFRPAATPRFELGPGGGAEPPKS